MEWLVHKERKQEAQTCQHQQKFVSLLQARSCKRSETLFKSLHFWLAGEVSCLAVEVLSPCQKQK